MYKKALAIALSLVMLVGIIPMSVAASGPVAESVQLPASSQPLIVQPLAATSTATSTMAGVWERTSATDGPFRWNLSHVWPLSAPESITFDRNSTIFLGTETGSGHFYGGISGERWNFIWSIDFLGTFLMFPWPGALVNYVEDVSFHSNPTRITFHYSNGSSVTYTRR